LRNKFLTSEDVKRAAKPDMNKLKHDVIYGSDKLLNFKPREDQLPVYQAIQEGAKRILICKGRRWGGTAVSTSIILTILSQNPRTKVGMFAPGWDEAEVAMDWFREHLANSIIQSSITEELKFSLKFSNGSSIIARIASATARGKRGRGFDVLYFPEGAFIPDQELHVIRVSKLDRPGAIEIMESSPNGMNHFFKSFNNPKWVSFRFRSDQNPLIDKTELAEERDEMTDIQARQELDAEFIDDSTAPFPQILIDEALKTSAIEQFWTKREEDGFYVAGLDLGRKRDRSVMVIMRVDPKNHLQIVHIKEFTYNSEDPRFWTKIIDHSEYLSKEFRIQNLLVDATGLGDKVVIDMKNQFAQNEVNTRIEGINFTYALKNKWEGLINQFSLKFERYKIHFPMHVEFIKQLKSIRFHTEKAKFDSIGKSPDIVMAAALAVRAAPQDLNTSFYSKANRRKETDISERPQKKLGVYYP